MARYKIKNWSEHQHYRDRAPPWVKLHTKLLNDYDFQRLPIASKALAPMLWLLASQDEHGTVEGDIERLAFDLRWSIEDVAEGLPALIDKGFLIAASDALADCKQSVPTENREQRTENREIRKPSAPKKPAQSDVPEEFMAAWKAYPSRPGSNRADSLKAWRARVNAGADPGDILAGVLRYSAYCVATQTAPNFIKQPATFFGPGEHYLSDWTIPAARASPQAARGRAPTVVENYAAQAAAARGDGNGQQAATNERDITSDCARVA